MNTRPPDVAATRLEAFVVAAPGLAPLVAAECVALGLTPGEVTSAGVALSVSERDLFRLNCWSRCGTRVLVRLAEFAARDFATLEKRAARVPWTRVIAPGMVVKLRVTCRKSRLYHSDAVAERVARGITAAVRGVRVEGQARDDEDGAEPVEAPSDAATQLIVVRLDRDQCTISADSSGDLLHRRGWRQAVAKAPLRETLGAAMLAASGWRGEEPLVDPFCGSGTLGIEAALQRRRIAPGCARGFAMERWPGADTAMMRTVRDEARAQQLPSAGVPIVLRDRDPGAIAAARANAERAGVLADLDIAQGALSETELGAISASGLLLTNPPYGLRVSEGADFRGLYARLGAIVRAGGTGWRLGLIMPPDPRLSGQLGLRLQRVLRMENGGVPVEFLLSTPPAAGDQTRK